MGISLTGVNYSPKVELIAKGHKFYMGLYSEIFRNLVVRTDCYQFLPPLAIGQLAYVMARCLFFLSVHPSVRKLFLETSSLKLIIRFLMKFYRNVPAMVPFRIS